MGDTGLVTDFCTCGAQLPPDALFCHKCGKLQRDEPLPVPEELAPAPVAIVSTQPASPPEIGFHNSQALRVAFLVGSLAFLLFSLPFPILLRLLFLLGAGVFSVYLYSRRSGHRVEIGSGARMGWITGLFCFVIFAVLFAASMAVLSVLLRDPATADLYRKQMGAMGMTPEMIQQATDLFKSPVQILGTLLSLFVTSTLIPALGGALGARLLRRNQ
jgi:hypothetical protein